jgi:hypothetical protein
MAPLAPHTPREAKQQDLDHFAHIADPDVRLKAAMNYALDRSVGQVLSALDDPNGDGNTSDSVRDNTIVVFLNDNGGQVGNDNSPLRGNKGLTWEGGLRVPFIVNMPGVAPGTFNAPITAYDVLPTVYAAAGGDVAQLDSDGVDLKPYFTGAATGVPHNEALFWRTNNIRGELLEVRQSEILVLRDSTRVTLVALAAIRTATFANRDEKISSGAVSRRDREKLRLLSRFPSGLPPNVEAQLLAAYGQTELEQVTWP